MASLKFRDLSRLHPDLQEALDVSKALGTVENPIAKAILGAARPHP